MSAVTFLTKLTTADDVTSVVMTFYVFSFGIMVCCFELQLKAVVQYIGGNFGFFFSPTLRTFFLVFIGLLCFDAQMGLFGKICGAVLFFVASLNFYALCMYPEYIQPPAISDAQKQAATKNATNFAFNAAANNPGLAKQAMGAATSV
jgi:hypothetical protein